MSLRASFALTIAFMLLSAVAQAAGISYSKDIQPIFTDKCVVCHACYDSPCQLNLSAAEGAQRGANKLPVLRDPTPGSAVVVWRRSRD